MTEDQVAALLRRHAPSEQLFRIVLDHSRAVRDVALRIADGRGAVDRGLIETGALLHDIGRFVCPGGRKTCRHGLDGAEILRAEGLPDEAMIAERHVGSGITGEEIIERDLPLPHRDFIPLTPEEQIVCHADNLVSGTRERSFDEYLRKLRGKHSADIVARATDLRDAVENLQRRHRTPR